MALFPAFNDVFAEEAMLENALFEEVEFASFKRTGVFCVVCPGSRHDGCIAHARIHVLARLLHASHACINQILWHGCRWEHSTIVKLIRRVVTIAQMELLCLRVEFDFSMAGYPALLENFTAPLILSIPLIEIYFVLVPLNVEVLLALIQVNWFVL